MPAFYTLSHLIFVTALWEVGIIAHIVEKTAII